jgi:hypothetical protein
MKTTCMQRAKAAALRRPQTVLWRSILDNGGTVKIGTMRFRLGLSDADVAEIFKSKPHHWCIRLGTDLWAQEVLPGSDEWEDHQ